MEKLNDGRGRAVRVAVAVVVTVFIVLRYPHALG